MYLINPLYYESKAIAQDLLVFVSGSVQKKEEIPGLLQGVQDQLFPKL